MDEFYEYWELIPENAKFEAIGQEIVKYKRNLQEPDVTARDLSENVIKFFQDQLLNNPYPTYFILYHIIDIKDYEKNKLLEDLILNTITRLIDLIIERPLELDKQFKLLNLLSNVFVSDQGMQKIHDVVIPALFDLKENRRLIDNASTYFALLSRNSLDMLRQYLEYEHARLLERFDERTVFLKCYYQQRHWIDYILKDENRDFLKHAWSSGLFNSVQVCRLILKISEYDDERLWNENKSIDSSVIENDTLRLCFLEVARQCELSRFSRAHSGCFAIDTTKSRIMTQLLRQQVTFSMEHYDAIFNVLSRNHELNVLQNEIYRKLKEIPVTKTEMQLLNEYMIVKIYLIDILHERGSPIDDSLKHVRALLKTINDGNVLYRLMEIIISLVFLRFDHVRKTRLRRKGNEETDLTPSQNNSTDVSDSVFIDSFNNTGFICTRRSLETILHSLRQFLASLDINEAYKNANSELKEKFAKMLKYVDKGLWKLNIIDKSLTHVEKQKYKCKTSREWLLIHDDPKSAVAPEKTSDEERLAGRKKSQPRRKTRKRSKLSHKSDDRDEDSENENLLNSTITETSENKVKINEDRRPENIINKMLMTPDSMIALCIQQGDFDSAEKIVNEYELSGSSADDEIKFIKRYDEAVREINAFAHKYEEVVAKQKNDQSKLFSAVGFELAKLSDALEKFATCGELKHVKRNKRLIERVVSQFPQLWAYQMPYPVITTIVDFMVSCPSQSDMHLAISQFICKRWNLLGEDRQHYYIGFLKNIVEVLNILKSEGRLTSISSFFNNEIDSCDPIIFKTQMDNRQHLLQLLDTDPLSLNDDSVLDDMITKVEGFQCDTNYLRRAVHYVRNTRMMEKFLSNEFIETDRVMSQLCVSDMIGEIIFIQQYHPDLLTNFCFNANINLLHTIGIAGVGKILPPKVSMEKDEKLLSLFHLHQLGSVGIESDCDAESDGGKIFSISHTDILYYVKKSGSFLVAYLLKELQNFDYKTLHYDEPNFFERMKALDTIELTKELYDGNTAMAVLNYDHNNLKKLFKKIETLELREKLRMLDCITEKNWAKDRVQFNELRDTYIEMLIERKSHDGTLELLKQIGNIKKFNELLLKHIRAITSDSEVERLLGWSLCSENLKEVSAEQKCELQLWLRKLKIYQEILKVYDSESKLTWLNVLEMAESNTPHLIDFLMNVRPDFVLCQQLLSLHPLAAKSEEIYNILVEALNRKSLNAQHPLLFKIIRTFPSPIVVDFFNYALGLINNLEAMRVILADLASRSDALTKMRVKYQKFQLSCKIIEHLGCDNNQLWLLASFPLIILEQALMNSKIELLSALVKELRVFLKDQPSCNLCNTTSRSNQVGQTLVYEYDAHHAGMWISNDCIDFLLKIYAAKALDFQIVDINSQLSQTITTTSGAPSIDSMQSRVFQMPKDAPAKPSWVPDHEAASCMCCRKSKFSLLTRRHHCRRCGRVVCADCSRNRILLPELYSDLLVRCCDECFTQLEDEKRKVEIGSIERARSAEMPLEWRLTGDASVDQMIRDEFTFEYSPNVGLCIAIICLHTINDEFTNFLLFHCHRLELLLRPINGRINPEIDIILVARMLKNLAMTAKLFGDMGESNLIIDHADMILKIAENGCEAVLSKASFTNLIFSVSIRDVVNELIKSENWKLAIELSVKWDRNSKSGIFSAWAVSLIRGGQYKLAREKIALALQPVPGSSSRSNEQLLTAISGSGPIYPMNFVYKRPARSSPLLNEIIDIIESCVPKQQQQQNVMVTSSMASLSQSQRLNTSSSLKITNVSPLEASLKRIIEGDYGGETPYDAKDLLKSSYYEESMHYLINYAGNADIFDFFLRNNLMRFALRYTLLQKVPHDMFVQCVFVPLVKAGKLNDLVKLVSELDENFVKSRVYIQAVSKHLERKKALHVLYQVQLLIGDYVRAAQTSIKFYLDGAGNYHELNEKSRHLLDAKNHLQTELERVEKGEVATDANGIQLRWDIKSLNARINIISLQLEVTKYLAHCELNGLPTLDLMPKIFMDKMSLKTLLGKPSEMNQVVILVLICGHTIESAFGLAYRIIQECSILPLKIYTTCTKYLARDLKRLLEVEKLIACIKTNASSVGNVVDPDTERMCDELIAMAVEIAYSQHQSEAKVQIDQLIRLIKSKTIKIQCYINSNQLKTAFVNCATLPNNVDYVRRIMKQAEITRQENIRRLCEKKLQQSMSSSMSDSITSSIDRI